MVKWKLSTDTKKSITEREYWEHPEHGSAYSSTVWRWGEVYIETPDVIWPEVPIMDLSESAEVDVLSLGYEVEVGNLIDGDVFWYAFEHFFDEDEMEELYQDPYEYLEKRGWEPAFSDELIFEGPLTLERE